MRITLCLVLTGLLCVAAGSAVAEEPAAEKESLLADLKLGEHWGGPELKLEDLQGKVVLFVLWGS